MPKALPSRHLSTDAALEAGRGVVRPTREKALAKHVGACRVCVGKVNRWRSLAAVTARLRAADPPEEIVGRARALAVRPGRLP
jgi:hypothetical protein